MKKLLFSLAFCSVSLFSVAQGSAQQAPQGSSQPVQPGQGPSQRKFGMDPKAQTEKMAAQLGLTDAQKTQVLIINNDVVNKMKALRANQDASVDKQQGRKKIETDRDIVFKGVLTDEQYRKYTLMKEDAARKRL